jgi:quinol monooxygenase YgiN
MAVIVVATALPVPEQREEVIAAFEAAIGKVHAEEDGCELYALHEGPDGRLVMIEKYTSDEAVAAHRAGTGLAALRENLNGKLAAAMDVVQVLAPLPAGSPVKGAL